MRVVSCLVASILCSAAPARAARIDWSGMADTLIHTVARARDMPVPILALAITEDRQGFLWAGGEGGLLRWDGYQFRAYKSGSGVADGLPSHFVHALHTDRQGRLWAGTQAGGLARYDEAADRFIPVSLSDARGEAQNVWGLDDDGAGGLWIGTDRGLAHLDQAGQAVPSGGSAGAFAVPGRKVEAVLRSRTGTVWIGGPDGLARLDPQGRAVSIPLAAPRGATPEVAQLLEDSAGRLWAGTRQHGAYVIDPAGHTAPVPLPPGLSVPDGGLEVMAVEEVEPGRIWLGTFGHGIIDVTAATLSSRLIARNPALPATLGSDTIYRLHRDRAGTVWIGTTGSLDQLVRRSGGIETLFGRSGLKDGIPNDISAVLVRPDGSVWLGSENDGILILGRDGKPRARLPVQRVFALAASPGDAAAPVYIGTRSGLFAASPTGDSIAAVAIPGRRPTAGVGCLAVIDGTIWVGGTEDDGLWQLHRTAAGIWTTVRHVTTPVLPNATITALGEAPGAKVAVGTGQGLVLLDPVTGTVEAMPAGHGNPANEIVSFLTDRHGRLWVGTDDNGIDVMLGRDRAGRPIWRQITVADGLPDGDINRMLTDGTGRVWASTDNGLALIDPDGFAVTPLREADGVAIPTYWSASGDRTADGDLLFGGMGGLTVVQPDTVHAWAYQPRVAISDIHLGGKQVRARDASLVVRPEANSMAVEFAALDFSAPERNLYRYKLDGYDADYVTTDARHRVAAYTNLPPGRYTLRLQGSNRNGVWSDAATLPVRVLPAWFETAWFRLLEGLVLAALCAGIVQARTVWLRRRQHDLEALVRERTSELVSRTDELVLSQHKLTQLAYYDPLTSLPNRRSFNELLAALLEDVGQPPCEFALILIDLDGFKRVNDTLGHDAGDEVLVVAAERLRGALREHDFVARLGGDEFAVLLRHGEHRDIIGQLCDRLVAKMTAALEIRGAPVKIGASVGVAVAPRHGRSAEDLYKHADMALYDAKRGGKGMWCWYQDAALDLANSA